MVILKIWMSMRIVLQGHALFSADGVDKNEIMPHSQVQRELDMFTEHLRIKKNPERVPKPIVYLNPNPRHDEARPALVHYAILIVSLALILIGVRHS
jgi:hypothetical protein